MKNKNAIKNLAKNKYIDMFPNFKEKRAQQITSLALTLSALILFGLFAINPTLSTIARLNKELSDAKFVDEQLQRKINNLSLLQQNYTSIQPDIQYVTDAIPSKAEAPTLVAQIQAIGLNTNVSITSVQVFQVEVDKKASPNKYSSFAFNLAGQGDYQSIISFINELSNMQRIVTFDTLTIAKRGDQGNSLQVNIKGSAYFKE